MNETLIEKWNSCITPSDTIIHFGDFFMGRAEDIQPILSRLNGRIILLRGNHDYSKRVAEYEKGGVIVKDIEYISYKGLYFICSHIPIGNKECMEHLIGANGEIWNLHGHTHQNTNFGEVPHTYHVGVDSHNMMPISLKEVWRDIMLHRELE